MMQSFSRGWNFLKQAWSMAFKDRDLLKPSIYALFVGMIVSVIGIIPIVGAALLLGDNQFGNIALFALGAVLVFVQFVVTYIFSGMTVYLIFGYLSGGETVITIAGIAVGALIFFAFVMVAGVFSSYTNTAEGKPAQVAAPAPLAAVLA